MLWKRDFMLARPQTTFVVDYCQYGTASQKATMLWSNTLLQVRLSKDVPWSREVPSDCAPDASPHREY